MGGKGKAGRTVVRNAIHLVEEFRAANEGKIEHPGETIPPVFWKPPSQGFYKVNLDGAVFSKTKQAGAGVIIRDEAGEVIAALSKKWKWPLGAIEAEAKPWKLELNLQKMLESERQSLRVTHCWCVMRYKV